MFVQWNWNQTRSGSGSVPGMWNWNWIGLEQTETEVVAEGFGTLHPVPSVSLVAWQHWKLLEGVAVFVGLPPALRLWLKVALHHNH